MNYALHDLPVSVEARADHRRSVPHVLRHPIYAWLGLRPALGQHTREEHATLKRWAAGRSHVVEIGVAEGVSALALREAMDPDGTLYLIDPFHLSTVPALNFTKRTARRMVHICRRARVLWIEKFSMEAVKTWNVPIDLLLIDGDHQEAAVEQDWTEWSGFVRPGGIVIFHDARLFDGGWTTSDYGPVRLVNRLFRENKPATWSIAEEIHSVVVLKRND